MAEERTGDDGGYLEKISTLNNEIVNLQRELSGSNAELKKALELKNRYVGMVVHDLRNPLAIISMYAETLQRRMDDPVFAEACLKTIRDSADFMADLIESILDTASLEAGTFSIAYRAARLDELAANVVRRLSPVAESRALAVEERIAELPAFFFDPFRIEQVLSNLLSNAFKYTPSGGVVRIELRRDGESALIRVADTGMGIPEEEREKIFSFFGRTSNVSPHGDRSVGLGLALCKHIVEAHRGTIGLESARGEGTVVTVSLPMLVDAERAFSR